MDDSSEYSIDGFGDKKDEIGSYEGDRNEDGERHGHGLSRFPNGDSYEGEYTNGKRNGNGDYKFKNARYVDIFLLGKFSGIFLICLGNVQVLRAI